MTTPCPADGRAPDGTPLYVHLPFCAAKCHYCDFFSVPDAGQDIDGLVEAVLAEAGMRAPRRPSTVFLGGGTPSLLAPAQLERLLDGLESLTSFRDSAAEVTTECNPESLDLDKARCLRDLGVGRLSIGFQSLDDRVLERFGRVHSVDDSFRAYEAARDAGVGELNVDLIYAAPGQSAAVWESELARVIELEPDHVSAYNLTFEKGTRFELWREQGQLEPAAEELELELFQIARERLPAAGLHPYEISNYAPEGSECRHNLNYWRNGPYVGLGPGAVSKLGTTRSGNPRNIGAWRRAIADGRDAAVWDEQLSPPSRLAETWWLGLRLAEGVAPAEARARAGLGPEEETEDPAVRLARGLEASGHLAETGGRWRLTDRGLPVADAVASEFLRRLPEGAREGLEQRALA